MTFSPEQVVQIVAIACEKPQASGRPISRWTAEEIAEEAVQRGIVKSVSVTSVKRFLGEAQLRPHRSQYWLNAAPKDPEVFEAQVKQVCQLYESAQELEESGIHLVSTDEMTGIQALEREHPDQPMQPEQATRLEFEYERHGTVTLSANWHVALGQVVAPSIGPTRKECDFANHVANTIETSPEDGWIFLVAQLNTHKSALLK